MQKSSRKLLKSVLIHIVMVEIFLVEPDPMLLLPRAPATPDPGPVTPVTPVTQRHSLRLRGPDWTVALAMVLARDSAHTLPYCHRGHRGHCQHNTVWQNFYIHTILAAPATAA